MSRANYSEDLEQWEIAMWRGQVASAIRGKRGQKFLRDLLVALDALPDKSLIRHELQNQDGEVCAIGALGLAHGIDMSDLDSEEPVSVAAAFDIAEQLAREVAYMNDEYYDTETPEARYVSMKKWVVSLIKSAPVERQELPEG